MTGEAGEEGIIDGFDSGVGYTHSLADEIEGTAQVSEADVSPLSLLVDFLFHLNVELQNHPFLLFRENTAGLTNLSFLRVSFDDLPEVALTLKFGNVDFQEFAPQTAGQLFLTSGRVRRVHAHEDAEIGVSLSLHDICSLVEQDVVSLNDSSQSVEDRFWSKVDLIK